MTATDRFSTFRLLWMLLLSRWYVGLGALAVPAGLAVLGYFYRDPIAETYARIHDAVLAALGVGVIPVATWLMALAYALGWRRAWLRRPNLWIGSLAFLATVQGVASFFRPDDGIVSVFASDGASNLGGRAGTAIAGPVLWLGALRTLGMLIAAVWLTFPGPTTGAVKALGSLVVYGYVVVALAVKMAFLALARMYRFDAKSSRTTHRARTDTAGGTTRDRGQRDRLFSEPATAWLNMPALEAPALETVAESTMASQAATATGAIRVEAPSVAVETEEVLDDGLVELMDGSSILVEPERRDEPESPSGTGKYNRFWASPGSQPDSSDSASRPLEQLATETVLDDRPVEAHVPEVAESDEPWGLPPSDLLIDGVEGGIAADEISETAETIKRTLAEYRVEVEIGQVRPGPAVTMYGLEPGWVRRYKQAKAVDDRGRPRLDDEGKPITTQVESKTRVKVDSILSREKDLALALKTPSIRIETPVMGKSLVGIEVPNPTPALVTLRNVMAGDEFQKLLGRAKLPIALGKGSGGEDLVVDLAKMPHLLVAGATGSGKSVFINTIVSCLIAEKSPAEMRLLLVDPKRVELTPYNGIPHLLTPVVVETDKVVGLLKGLIHEMFNRYRRMEEVGVRNIDAYNKRVHDKMPLLVVAVDELADLMMSASFDVEQSLCRLAQLGRATGIHLVVATQRPSVDVVTGLIKANFPSRVSFGVTSQIDSRTIMDTAGAEKLLGRGDMLYLAQDASRPERAQGVFISDAEIEKVVGFWQATPRRRLPPVLLRPADDDESEGAGDEDDDVRDRDELIEKAIELAHQHSKLSTSLLQRRMRIGYPRAARLMDQLEEEGRRRPERWLQVEGCYNR